MDPKEHTVDEIKEEISEIEDPEELEKVLEKEKEGKDRVTAKEAVEDKIDKLTPKPDGGEDEKTDEAEDDDGEDEEEEGEPTADKQYIEGKHNGVYRDMWVYCETQHGELMDVSKEMLGEARNLMDEYNEDYIGDERPDDANENENYTEEEKVVAVLIGDDMEDLAEEAIEYGADLAIFFDDDSLERFLHKPYTEVFVDMARADYDWHDYDNPRYVLFPATNNGRDLSAMVQAELDSGLASDCNELFIEPHEETNPMKTGERGETKVFERTLHMKRPDFSGFEWSTILCLDNPDRDFHPQGASVIPGSFDIPGKADREGEVVEHEMDIEDEWLDVDIEGYEVLDEGIDLTGHEVVVALGRGIGEDPTRGLELGQELTEQFDDAALGLSRGIVTASYDLDGHVEEIVTEERQIGETGQEVEPDLYIAAGISGAVQHKVGMDESEVILTINTDRDARIKDFSDYFIIGDLFEVIPQLIDSLEEGELKLPAAADGGEIKLEGGEN
ncbi:MAG: electron transfer flavoprotein subunit alpha/FixB family protein [Halobacteria archaeon]